MLPGPQSWLFRLSKGSLLKPLVTKQWWPGAQRLKSGFLLRLLLVRSVKERNWQLPVIDGWWLLLLLLLVQHRFLCFATPVVLLTLNMRFGTAASLNAWTKPLLATTVRLLPFLCCFFDYVVHNSQGLSDWTRRLHSRCSSSRLGSWQANSSIHPSSRQFSSKPQQQQRWQQRLTLGLAAAPGFAGPACAVAVQQRGPAVALAGHCWLRAEL